MPVLPPSGLPSTAGAHGTTPGTLVPLWSVTPPPRGQHWGLSQTSIDLVGLMPEALRNQRAMSITRPDGPATLVDLFFRVENVFAYGSYCPEVLQAIGPVHVEHGGQMKLASLASAVEVINVDPFRTELATLVAMRGHQDWQRVFEVNADVYQVQYVRQGWRPLGLGTAATAPPPAQAATAPPPAQAATAPPTQQLAITQAPSAFPGQNVPATAGAHLVPASTWWPIVGTHITYIEWRDVKCPVVLLPTQWDDEVAEHILKGSSWGNALDLATELLNNSPAECEELWANADFDVSDRACIPDAFRSICDILGSDGTATKWQLTALVLPHNIPVLPYYQRWRGQVTHLVGMAFGIGWGGGKLTERRRAAYMALVAQAIMLHDHQVDKQNIGSAMMTMIGAVEDCLLQAQPPWKGGALATDGTKCPLALERDAHGGIVRDLRAARARRRQRLARRHRQQLARQSHRHRHRQASRRRGWGRSPRGRLPRGSLRHASCSSRTCLLQASSSRPRHPRPPQQDPAEEVAVEAVEAEPRGVPSPRSGARARRSRQAAHGLRRARRRRGAGGDAAERPRPHPHGAVRPRRQGARPAHRAAAAPRAELARPATRVAAKAWWHKASPTGRSGMTGRPTWRFARGTTTAKRSAGTRRQAPSAQGSAPPG